MFDYATTIDEARARRRLTPAAMLPPVESLDPRGAFLAGAAGDVTSQGGEDGLIAAVLARVGVRNRWCFEVGAADGVRLSNTWALRRCGWNAVLVEGDAKEYAALVGLGGVGAAGTVHAVHRRVGWRCLDGILRACGAPPDLDLGVIDVDGEDVYVWGGLVEFRPRVVLVEYNPGGSCVLPNPRVWQAGLDDVVALGRRKGYVALARTLCNVLFVDEGAGP